MLRGIEWNSLNFTWASDAHGSIVWTILFLHSYDIVADMLMTAVLIVIVASGRYGPRQRIGVHVDSVLWYFLVGIWIPLYGVVLLGAAADRRWPMKQAVLGAGLVSSADCLVCQPRSKLCARASCLRRAWNEYARFWFRPGFGVGGGQRPAGLDTAQFSPAAWLSPERRSVLFSASSS